MRLFLFVLTVVLVLPAAAQVGDDQTEEYEEQDRRYYERYLEKETPADSPPLATDTFITRAEALVKDKNYRSASSANYRVHTDDPRIDAEAVTDLLESFRAFFVSFWSGGPELSFGEGRTRMFLFLSFYKYDKLLAGDWSRRLVRPKGHYLNLHDAIALHTGADDAGNLSGTVVHEATHQLVNHGMFTGDHEPPPWISEGLASYFGYTFRESSGEFRAGEIGGKPAPLFRRSPPGRPGESSRRLRMLRQALKSPSGEGPLVHRLVSARKPADFYRGNVFVQYGASWMLVHFLLHGEDGAHRDAFVRYLGIERDGEGGADRFYEAIGLGPEELQTRFVAHVKRVKTR